MEKQYTTHKIYQKTHTLKKPTLLGCNLQRAEINQLSQASSINKNSLK